LRAKNALVFYFESWVCGGRGVASVHGLSFAGLLSSRPLCARGGELYANAGRRSCSPESKVRVVPPSDRKNGSGIVVGVRSPLRGLEFLVWLSQGCAPLALGYFPWLPPGADFVGAWGELGGWERIAWVRRRIELVGKRIA
jgi:hypothetical protein